MLCYDHVKWRKISLPKDYTLNKQGNLETEFWKWSQCKNPKNIYDLYKHWSHTLFTREEENLIWSKITAILLSCYEKEDSKNYTLNKQVNFEIGYSEYVAKVKTRKNIYDLYKHWSDIIYTWGTNLIFTSNWYNLDLPFCTWMEL